MRANAQPVLGLDVLRLIAAFMVVLYHLGFRAFSDDGYLLNDLIGGHARFEAWSPFTWFGWVGVQVFFVISGFVIAFSSEGATPFKFIRSRILRLVPGMWICAVVCGLLALSWGTPLVKMLVLSAKAAAFVPIGPWIAGQIWTIGIELAFYAVVLALLVMNAFNRIEWVAYALAAASAVYWLLVGSGTLIDSAGRITQLLLLQHGCYFAIGLLIWIMSKKGGSLTRSVACAVCVGTAWFQIDATLLAEAPDYGFIQHPAVPFIAWTSLTLLMAISVFYNSRILGSVPRYVPAVTRTAGVMTYSLYLLHYHVGGTVLMAARDLDIDRGISLVLAIVASTAAAYVSAKILEPAIYALLKAPIDRVGGEAAKRSRATA